MIKKKRNWVWYSTLISFEASKISILAIVETILASGCYFFAIVKFGTLHLTLTAFIAPMLLLRTEESVRFALEHSESYKESAIRNIILPQQKVQTVFAFEMFLIIILFFVIYVFLSPLISEDGLLRTNNMSAISDIAYFYALAGILLGIYLYFKGFAIRLYATIRCLFVYPSKSISEIPSNWWRYLVCLDTLHPPEVLPCVIKYEAERNYVSRLQPFGFFYASSILDRNKFSGKPPMSVALDATLCLVLALPTYLYRWSIKGSSALMLPMIWLLYDSKKTKPEHISKSIVFKGLFRMSCVILLCFIVKLLLYVIDVYTPEKLTILKKTFPPLFSLMENENNEIIHKIIEASLPCGVSLLMTAFLIFCFFLLANRLMNRGYSGKELCWFRYLMKAIGFSAVCLVFSLIYLFSSI
ncbi:MAG: hypothetical protein NTX45_07250 [Proteobacteria bacterium]|nr:hypothetical protein [Pseudomonadota bacterium]